MSEVESGGNVIVYSDLCLRYRMAKKYTVYSDMCLRFREREILMCRLMFV